MEVLLVLVLVLILVLPLILVIVQVLLLILVLVLVLLVLVLVLLLLLLLIIPGSPGRAGAARMPTSRARSRPCYTIVTPLLAHRERPFRKQYFYHH